MAYKIEISGDTPEGRDEAEFDAEVVESVKKFIFVAEGVKSATVSANSLEGGLTDLSPNA